MIAVPCCLKENFKEENLLSINDMMSNIVKQVIHVPSQYPNEIFQFFLHFCIEFAHE